MSPLVVVKQVSLPGDGTVGRLQVEVRQESPRVVGTGEIPRVVGTAVIPQAEVTDVTGQAGARSRTPQVGGT